MELGDMVMYMG